MHALLLESETDFVGKGLVSTLGSFVAKNLVGGDTCTYYCSDEVSCSLEPLNLPVAEKPVQSRCAIFDQEYVATRG